MICICALALITVSAVDALDANQFDDDAIRGALNGFNGGAAYAYYLTAILCLGVGIYGAMKYNWVCVAVSLAYYAVYLLMSFLALSLGNLLLCGFFAYPHVYLIKEIREGVMSEQNYPQEKQSCCCV